MRSVWAMAALAIGLAGVLATASEAEAKQCVWNKGAFMLRVDWFEPFSYDAPERADGSIEITFKKQPVQTDVFPAAQGRCIDRGSTRYWAVLSIYGGHSTFRIIEYPSDWTVERRIDAAIFLAEIPLTTRYLDVWGVMLSPAYTRDGGPI